MGRKLDAGRQAIVERMNNLQLCNKKDDCALTLRGVRIALQDFDYAIERYNRETAALKRIETPE